MCNHLHESFDFVCFLGGSCRSCLFFHFFSLLGSIPMEDELRTTNTFEDAKVSEFDDVAESDVANHSASAAVAQVEHLVLRATEA